MTQPTTEHREPARRPAPPAQYENPWIAMFRRFIAEYFWFVFKNVIGWIFILGALPVGIAVPGPGGIPLFLIGFALVTFPGKRKLTARVLRGRQMDLQQKRFDIIEIAIAVVFSTVLFWPFEIRYVKQLNLHSLTTAFHITMALVVLSIMWVLTRFALRGLNLLIRVMPRMRRK